ncbi:MAG TPA: hypothetical protein VFU19_11815 [Iamia sp.]|nr:hypothetical protein [Iamia sp.]
MTAPPHAPWALRGEALVALSWSRPPLALPDGIDRAPGPTLIAAVRYTDSPVGPFLQLMVLVPARLGAHVGWSAVVAVVDKPDAVVGFNLSWGIPATHGELRWFARDGVRQLLWEDRDLSVKARGRGIGVPMVMPHRLVQARSDGPVVVPDRHWGLFRPALVTVDAGPRDALDCLRGRHLGATVDGVHRTIAPARTPIGLLAPLRAPARAESILRRD